MYELTESHNFLTIRQASKTLHLPENALRTWCKTGKLPGFRQGNRFYVDAAQLLTDIREGKLAN